MSLCSNDALLPRDVAEAEVLAGSKRLFLSSEVIQEITLRVRAEVRRPKAKGVDRTPRIAQLKAEVGNMVEAIASGVLKASSALATRLATAEAEIEELERTQAASAVAKADVLPHLAGPRNLAVKAVERLEHTLASGDTTRARREIRDYIGIVNVEADAREIRPFSDQGHVAAALLRAVGSNARLFGSGGRI